MQKTIGILIVVVFVISIIAILSIGINLGFLWSKEPSTNDSNPTITPTPISQTPISPTSSTPTLAPNPTFINSNEPLEVGDYFIYSLTGTSSLGIGATVPNYFSQYNDTNFYKVTVTTIAGTEISLRSDWRFLNGTEITSQQTINLATGTKTNSDGFWAVYLPNLSANELLRPNGFDGLKVNATDTQSYTTFSRTRNFFSMENQFYDVNDPTHNTMRYDSTSVYFDKQTGMLTTLSNYQEYNNPQMILIITWKLIETNKWTI